MNRRPVWIWVQRLARIALGLVFLLAGTIKILGPKESPKGRPLPGIVNKALGQKWDAAGIAFRGPIAFRDEIKNYQLGPFYWVIHPAAIALPWVEVALGLGLIAGVWLFESTVLTVALLVFFNFLVALAMHRGLDINCGCFGGETKVGWYKLSENAVFILLGIIGAWGSRSYLSSKQTVTRCS